MPLCAENKSSFCLSISSAAVCPDCEDDVTGQGKRTGELLLCALSNFVSPGGGGGTQIIVGQGCAAENSDPIHI